MLEAAILYVHFYFMTLALHNTTGFQLKLVSLSAICEAFTGMLLLPVTHFLFLHSKQM